MSLDDAMNPANLLCYEMNGSPLPAANGFPVRLIALGAFGVCNVKWLRRHRTARHRLPGTVHGSRLREVERDGKTTVTETSVGRLLLKSAPARVAFGDGHYRIEGMAWGPAPIAAVEVKVDSGPWMKATLDDNRSDFSWRSWRLDWSPAPGEHTITSRAIDKGGSIQPAMDDPSIATRRSIGRATGS